MSLIKLEKLLSDMRSSLLIPRGLIYTLFGQSSMFLLESFKLFPIQ